MQEQIPIHSFSKINTDISIKEISQRNEEEYFPAHRHNFYELIFFTEGKGTHRIDFTDYEVANNLVYFISPGQIHEMQTKDRKGYVIVISKEVFYNIQKIENISFSALFNNIQQVKIVIKDPTDFNMLISLLKNEQNKTNTNRHLLRNYVSAILITCIESSNIEKDKEQDYRIYRLMDEINQSFRKERTGKFYSDKLCISLKHLNDISNKILGRTLTQLIHERIILEAKREIAYTNKSIKEIAYELGFKDPAYFNRFFKKFIKQTPETFRRISK